jgi:uncharacterized protein (TIGR00251 family)
VPETLPDQARFTLATFHKFSIIHAWRIVFVFLKVVAAPEDGKANAELCAFLAKTLGCPKKDVNLQAGEKSRLKTVSLPLGIQEQLEHICGNS